MATKNQTILISGASIAGPTLAYWLKRYGFTPTVVERSPVLRAGGFPIDVRNEAVEIAKRMGIWSDLQQKSTTLDELSFMDARNRRISGINILTLRKMLDLDRTWAEILRGDLAETLYEATKNEVEYLFGDSIQAMAQDDDGVDVTFASGGTRHFDLVAGADGVHSNTRQLVFGDEAPFEWYCGYQVAVFTTTDNYLRLDHTNMLIYGVPGKQVMIRSSRDNKELGACFMFKQPTKLHYDRSDEEQQKQLLADVYADQAWEIPTLLARRRCPLPLASDGPGFNARHDGGIYSGRRTASDFWRPSPGVSTVRAGIQTGDQQRAKKAQIGRRFSRSRDTVGSVGAQSPGSGTRPIHSSPGGNLEPIVPSTIPGKELCFVL